MSCRWKRKKEKNKIFPVVSQQESQQTNMSNLVGFQQEGFFRHPFPPWMLFSGDNSRKCTFCARWKGKTHLGHPTGKSQGCSQKISLFSSIIPGSSIHPMLTDEQKFWHGFLFSLSLSSVLSGFSLEKSRKKSRFVCLVAKWNGGWCCCGIVQQMDTASISFCFYATKFNCRSDWSCFWCLSWCRIFSKVFLLVVLGLFCLLFI